jgi:hypothetical protein
MAYAFNGTNQYLVTTGAPAQNVPITIAAYGYANNVADAFALVTLAAAANINNTYVVYMSGNLAGDPIWIFNSNTTGSQTGSVASLTGYESASWVHGVGVFGTTSSRSAYINGGGKQTNTDTVSSATPTRLGIGAWVQSTVQRHMNGQIAEVAVWAAALSDDEVTSLAKGFKASRVRPQSLVFYAPLIRGAIDLRSNLAISNINTATVANHPRVYG